MAQVATELVTKFSFEGSTAPLTNFNSSLLSSLKVVGGMATALVGAGAGFYALFQGAVDSADAMGDLSARTGVSAGAIQSLGYMAQQSGSSVETLNQTLDGLTTKIGLASRGGEMELKKLSREFDFLGISVKKSDGTMKNAEDMMYDLNKAFNTMDLSTQEKSGILAKLGIDKSMIGMLSRTTSEFEKMRKEASLFEVSDAQIEQAQEFNDLLDGTKGMLGKLGMQMALSFAPKMNELMTGFKEFTIANGDLIKNGLSKFFEVVMVGLNAISNFIKLIFNVIDTTVGWQNALIILGGALIYFNRALLMSPIGLIVAGITAIILIIDDLTVAFEGGDSVIREFFLNLLGWDIVPFLKGIVTAFQSSFGLIKVVINGLFEWMGILWNGIVSFFKFDWLVSGIKSVVNSALNFFKPLIDVYNKIASVSGMSAIAMPQVQSQTLKNPVGSTNVSNTSKNNSLTQDIKIDIKTNDPKTAGSSVKGELNKYMKDSATQFNKGGR